MQINPHNLDIGSHTYNSKSTKVDFIFDSQILSFSTKPGSGNINLLQEMNEEVGNKRQYGG